MLVEWKGVEGARSYRGVTLSGPTEVTEEWFAECKNPAIVQVKKRGRPPKAKTEESEEQPAGESVTDGDEG